MNLKITFTVLAALLISLTSSYFILTANASDCNEEQNIYKSPTNKMKKSIFLIGSSQVGVLNIGYIDEQVSTIHPDFRVYESTKSADVPIGRLQTINQIVCVQPELVVYGVGFRDFSKLTRGNMQFLTFEQPDKPSSILPDPQIIFQSWFVEPFDQNLNPKSFTLKFLKNLIDKFEKQPKTYFLIYPDESELAGRSNLIFNLRADESLHDFSRHGVDPTTVFGYPKYVDGVIGSALSFAPSFIMEIDAEKLQSVSDFNFNSTDKFSIAYWMKTDSQNNWKSVVIAKSKDVLTKGWSNYFDENGMPTFRLSGTPYNTGLIVKYISEDIRDDKWRHFVWTYDGSENSSGVSLFINGSRIQLETVENNLRGSILNHHNVTIGAQGNHLLKLRADIDDIRIYKDELTLSEAQNLFEMKGISSKESQNISNSGLFQLINSHNAFAEQIVQQKQVEKTQDGNNLLVKENEFTPIELKFCESCGPDELKSNPEFVKQAKAFAQIDPYTLEKNSKALKKIINVLQNNEIKVVLFTTPYPEIILEQISDSDYALFNSTLQSISKEYDVPVYSLVENYSSMKVWGDTFHVTPYKKGIIYSEDVAKIILDEIPR